MKKTNILLIIHSLIILAICFWFTIINSGKINEILTDLISVVLIGTIFTFFSIVISLIYSSIKKGKSYSSQFPSFIFLLTLLIFLSLIITYKTKLLPVSLKNETLFVILYDTNSKKLLNKQELNGHNTDVIKIYEQCDKSYMYFTEKLSNPNIINSFYNNIIQISLLQILANNFSHNWSYEYENLQSPYVRIQYATPKKIDKLGYYDLKTFFKSNPKTLFYQYFSLNSGLSRINVPLKTTLRFTSDDDNTKLTKYKSMIRFQKKKWFTIDIIVTTIINYKLNKKDSAINNISGIDYKISFTADFNRIKIGSKKMDKYIKWAKKIEEIIKTNYDTNLYLKSIIH